MRCCGRLYIVSDSSTAVNDVTSVEVISIVVMRFKKNTSQCRFTYTCIIVNPSIRAVYEQLLALVSIFTENGNA